MGRVAEKQLTDRNATHANDGCCLGHYPFSNTAQKMLKSNQPKEASTIHPATSPIHRALIDHLHSPFGTDGKGAGHGFDRLVLGQSQTMLRQDAA
jgi:hypothetical protein